MAKVVLVHGAWHGAWCWEGVVDALEAKGVDVDAVELPVTSHADDIAEARRAIEAAGPGAVVCGHSYGGLVISNAASGLPVGRLVYLAAFMTDTGEDAFGYMQAYPSPLSTAMRTDTGMLTVDQSRAARVLLRGQRREASRRDRAPAAPNAAWRRLRDAGRAGVAAGAVDVCAVHEGQSDRSGAPSERWRCTPTKVIEWPTDHSPFLTRPQEIADLLASYT